MALQVLMLAVCWLLSSLGSFCSYTSSLKAAPASQTCPASAAFLAPIAPMPPPNAAQYRTTESPVLSPAHDTGLVHSSVAHAHVHQCSSRQMVMIVHSFCPKLLGLAGPQMMLAKCWTVIWNDWIYWGLALALPARRTISQEYLSSLLDVVSCPCPTDLSTGC